MSPDSSTGFLLRCWTTYLALLLLHFGAILWQPEDSADGHDYRLQLWGLTEGIHVAAPVPGEPPTWWDRARICFEGEVVPGHYYPVSVLIWTCCFGLGGEAQYLRCILGISFLLHCTSAMMIVALCRRFGMARIAAFLAGLIFLLHPINDINLSTTNGSLRLFATFFMLLAALANDAIRPGQRFKIGWCLLTVVAVFASINCFPSFLAHTPLLLAGLAAIRFVQEGRHHSTYIRRSLIWALPAVVAVALAVILRLTLYGELDSAKEYPRNAMGLASMEGWWQHFLALGPAPEVREGSLDSVSGVALAACPPLPGAWIMLIASVLLATWSEWRIASSSPGGSPCRRSALIAGLGLYLFAITTGIHQIIVGDTHQHRYLYIGLAGLSMVAAATAALLARVLHDRRGFGAKLLYCGLAALIVGVFGAVNLRSSASIVHRDRISRAVAQGVWTFADAHSEVGEIFVLNLPSGVGRAGQLFATDAFLNERVLWEIITRDRAAVLSGAAHPLAVRSGRSLAARMKALSEDPATSARTSVLCVDLESLDLLPARELTVTSPDGGSDHLTLPAAHHSPGATTRSIEITYPEFRVTVEVAR